MKHSVLNQNPTIPVVANIPHSSPYIPDDIREQFIISDAELAEENRLLVDWFTDELYAPLTALGGCALQHNISRFVLDPERFDDDSKEIMSSRGMGVIYTHGCSRQEIRRVLSHQEREYLLSRYYRPYHDEMNRLVRASVEQFGHCFFIDCHSYPEHKLPYEIDGNGERPDVVLGTDPYHTPEPLIEQIQSLTLNAGYTFGLNKPFAGTVVPLSCYKDTRVTAFMLEINRTTYMNEITSTHHLGFKKTQSLIHSIAELCLENSDPIHISEIK